jgi:hypothetical protein
MLGYVNVVFGRGECGDSGEQDCLSVTKNQENRDPSTDMKNFGTSLA